jgi:hypothetical protein
MANGTDNALDWDHWNREIHVRLYLLHTELSMAQRGIASVYDSGACHT